MRPVSEQWDARVRSSHTQRTKVELLVPGSTTPDRELEIADSGSVELDFNTATRARVSGVTVYDADLIPSGDPDDPLAPYGNEVRVWRGLRGSDGAMEWVSLGIFGIDDNAIRDTGDEFSVTFNGLDRSKRIERASFTETYTVASGTVVEDAIDAIIEDALPATTTMFATTDVSLPLLVAEPGDDRWAFCRGLAKAAGCDLYFDGDGVLVMQPFPDGSPVFTVADGEEGVLTRIEKQATREGMANYIVVTGESSEDDPVRAVAYDNVESSPTYYQGKFGIVPYFWTSKYVTAEADAQTAAENILATKRGLVGATSLGLVPNPALEPGDVISVERLREDGTELINDSQVIDACSIDLSPAAEMTLGTRSLSQIEVEV